MNRLFIPLTICIIAMVPLNVCAQETPGVDDDFEALLSSMKNPFKSPMSTKLELQEELKRQEEEKKQEELKRQEEEKKSQESVSVDIEPIDPSLQTSEPSEPIEIEVEEIIPLPDVKISGIIWNSDRPQAIINGRIVDIGDSILGIQITEIRKTGIDGLFHGRTVTIKN